MNPYRNAPLSVSILLLSAVLAGGALAADMPKRKSGLWEMKSQMEGMPSHGAVQMCVDQNSDNMLQDRMRNEKPDCSVMDVKPGAGKTTFHTVCRHEGTTVTTDGVITGDFSSGYKTDMTMRYNPPMNGMGSMRMQQEARWLGPCKAGQKPGDIIMPGMPGGRMNMQEMMKDPQVQEMMKRQRQGQ